jgi:8-oxo-dGTP pyrophosphatase MutT (NUDIX family)
MIVTMENLSLVMYISGKVVNMAILTATSAGAIILREMDGELKIALAQHQRSEKRWVIPKGHVELNESLEQAALREIQEETGLSNIQLLSHLGTVLRKSTRSSGDIVHKTVHYYLAYALSNNQPGIPLDESFTVVAWFSPEQVLELLPYEQEKDFVREHLGLLFR